MKILLILYFLPFSLFANVFEDCNAKYQQVCTDLICSNEKLDRMVSCQFEAAGEVTALKERIRSSLIEKKSDIEQEQKHMFKALTKSQEIALIVKKFHEELQVATFNDYLEKIKKYIASENTVNNKIESLKLEDYDLLPKIRFKAQENATSLSNLSKIWFQRFSYLKEELQLSLKPYKGFLVKHKVQVPLFTKELKLCQTWINKPLQRFKRIENVLNRLEDKLAIASQNAYTKAEQENLRRIFQKSSFDQSVTKFYKEMQALIEKSQVDPISESSDDLPTLMPLYRANLHLMNQIKICKASPFKWMAAGCKLVSSYKRSANVYLKRILPRQIKFALRLLKGKFPVEMIAIKNLIKQKQIASALIRYELLLVVKPEELK